MAKLQFILGTDKDNSASCSISLDRWSFKVNDHLLKVLRTLLNRLDLTNIGDLVDTLVISIKNLITSDIEEAFKYAIQKIAKDVTLENGLRFVFKFQR